MNRRDLDSDEFGGLSGVSELGELLHGARSWMDWFFPSRIERALFLVIYGHLEKPRALPA